MRHERQDHFRIFTAPVFYLIFIEAEKALTSQYFLRGIHSSSNKKPIKTHTELIHSLQLFSRKRLMQTDWILPKTCGKATVFRVDLISRMIHFNFARMWNYAKGKIAQMCVIRFKQLYVWNLLEYMSKTVHNVTRCCLDKNRIFFAQI